MPRSGGIRRGAGRPRTLPAALRVITLQIPLHMIAAIDENKRDGESRAEYIRVAISQRLGDDQFAEELAALREPRG